MKMWADIILIILYLVGMFIAYNHGKPWLVFVLGVAFMQQIRIIVMKQIVQVQGLVIDAQFRAMKDYEEEIQQCQNDESK